MTRPPPAPRDFSFDPTTTPDVSAETPRGPRSAPARALDGPYDHSVHAPTGDAPARSPSSMTVHHPHRRTSPSTHKQRPGRRRGGRLVVRAQAVPEIELEALLGQLGGALAGQAGQDGVHR